MDFTPTNTSRQIAWTDRTPPERPDDPRRAEYRSQGAAYQRALRDALGLAALPRFELWWLAADRAERFDSVSD